MMNEHSGRLTPPLESDLPWLGQYTRGRSQHPSDNVKQSDDVIANGDADCVHDDVVPAETTK